MCASSELVCTMTRPSLSGLVSAKLPEHMNIFGLRFSPSPWITVLTVITAGLLASLGMWQLDRAEQKRQLLDSWSHKAGEEKIRLTASLKADNAFRYQPAEVSGVMDAAHQFLLDNKVYQGRVGYHVLTPLRIDHSDAAVLVNRGWVPAGTSRSELPEIPVATDRVKVTGILDIPPEKVFSLGEGEDRAPGWPKVLQRIRLELQEQQLGYTLLPAVLLLDADQPSGFVRNWRPVVFGPEKHRGYAFQWFSLATVLLAIYLVLNTRRSSDRNVQGRSDNE